jgi:hypothetical protein
MAIFQLSTQLVVHITKSINAIKSAAKDSIGGFSFLNSKHVKIRQVIKTKGGFYADCNL